MTQTGRSISGAGVAKSGLTAPGLVMLPVQGCEQTGYKAGKGTELRAKSRLLVQILSTAGAAA